MAISSKSSFNKILILVFAVAFGLVGLALLFQGVQTASDIRSRAAQTNQIYKQWEFNGTDTEGWRGVSPYTGTVKGGMFVLSAPKTGLLPTFRNTGVSTLLPQGLKSVSLSMAVGRMSLPTPTKQTCASPPKCNGPVVQLMMGSKDSCPVYRCASEGSGQQGITEPKVVNRESSASSVQGASDESDDSSFQRSVASKVACTLEARACLDGSYVGRSGNACSFMPCPGGGKRQFVGYLYYKLTGRDKFERPVQFSGLADGTLQTYTVNLPNAESITMDSIRVVLASGVRSGEVISVDWIRLLGPVPTPTPANECKGPNGSSCSITNCPPQPTCASGQKCIQIGRACVVSQGTCQNNRCIPGSVPTPTPQKCTPLPACAYTTEPGKPVCMVSQYAPDGGSWCPRPPVTPQTTPPSGCYVLQTYPSKVVCPSGTPTPTPTPSYILR